MSYSATISFKSIKAEEILPFFREYKKEIANHFVELAEDEFRYNPVYRNYIFDSTPEFDEVESDIYNWALVSIFHYRYTYDAELGLLAVYGVPDCMEFMFDKSVYFQNSCDQDYPRKDWKGVKVFEDIYDKWQTATAEDILAASEYLDAIDDISDLDYWRRTCAYDEIWKHFKLSLDDENFAIYISLYGFYDSYIIRPFVKMVYDKTKKVLDEFSK